MGNKMAFMDMARVKTNVNLQGIFGYVLALYWVLCRFNFSTNFLVGLFWGERYLEILH